MGGDNDSIFMSANRQQRMSSQHYALVHSGLSPLPVAPQEEEKDPRSELIDLYQTYADLYPNPKLVEEARMRDALLQAASAASNFQAQNKKKKRRGGFFSSLFGGNGDKEEEEEEEEEGEDKDLTSLDPLIYSDIPNEDIDDSLCGTMQSIDLSCIPIEAYTMARFHLTSTRTCRENPNAIHCGPSYKGDLSFIVVGLGEIAEFTSNQYSRILSTSDREDLLAYTENTPGAFALHNVRAAALSENCVAVSWGFIDGIVVIYRRIQFPGFDGWEAVWMVGPALPVLEHMAASDVFHVNSEHPESPQLKVSGCIPLKVETGVDQQPMVASLAISRVGGFIEVVPLSTLLWNGPVLTPQNHQRQKQRPKRLRGRHYAFGKEIGSPERTLALTTLEYHIDIMCLEAFRTPVGADTEWNAQAYPDSPPAEFVVAASGMSQKGYETLTFWAVSTLFEDSSDNRGGEIDFQLHSALIEAITVNPGADVSVFASPGILKRWRTPRNVQLRDEATTTMEEAKDSTTRSNSNRVTTISITAPIVSIRFCNLDPSQPFSGFSLSLLDWNGGVTLYDCSAIERVAAQNLKDHEYELFHNASHDTPFPLAHTIVTRTQFSEALNSINVPDRNQGGQVGNLHWLAGIDSMLPPLVLLLRASGVLAVVTFTLAKPEDTDKPPRSHILQLQFNGKGAAMSDIGERGISFFSVRKGKLKSTLRYFLMKQLDPVAIVESLARESKFEEAIEAATKLEDIDQLTVSEIVEDCHKRIWESKRDVDSLAETRNVSYIVEEALSLCQSDYLHEELSLDKLRLICRLAITSGSNYGPTKSKIEGVLGFLVKLGTYELLCEYFKVEKSFKQFRRTMQNISMVDLSSDLAQKGDIVALSIVIFRHRRDIGEKILEILDAIPLTINPELYLHLFPIIRAGEILDSFFISIGDSGFHWAQMPQHLREKFGIAAVLDSTDEKLVLDYNQNCQVTSIGESDNLTSLLSFWFVERARSMQTFVGNMETVIAFCNLGLRCSKLSTEPSSLLSAPSTSQQLYKTWRRASSLQKMLDDGVVSLSSEDSKESERLDISTDDILNMDLIDLVNLVLRSERDGTKVMSRFTEYLQPLITDLQLSNSAKNSDIDSALTSYCLGLAHECQNIYSRKGVISKELLAVSSKTLALSAAVATVSKTSIRKGERLVKDKRELVEMVLTVVDDVSYSLQTLEVCDSQCNALVESLWILYEALPAHMPAALSASKMWVPLFTKIDTLFQGLVGIDVLSRWPGCHPFKLYNEMSREKDSSEATRIEAGNSILARVCQSFFTQLDYQLEHKYLSSLLRDLLSDVKHLNEACYECLLDVPAVMCMHLVRPLLQYELFHLVTDFIKMMPSGRENVKQTVLTYVDETVFSKTQKSNIVSAIKCQDIIGPIFPEIQSSFSSIRRYLDAAHFIATVIYEEKDGKAYTPSDLRRASALDVVESILRELPESVVCGCPQWGDQAFARDANKKLRQASKRQGLPEDAISSPALPSLPGGAIFHLATILGLEDDKSALVVKCRVVHHAVNTKLQGAAAAICRTLVQDGQPMIFENDAMALATLGAIAEVVADESYSDLSTKKELCIASLQRFTAQVVGIDSEAFDTITRVFTTLDHRTGRFDREHQDMSNERHQVLLSRPISRLHSHVLSEYNADVYHLFSDLLAQASQGLVHDSLLNALSKFVIFWCISDSKALKSSLDLAGQLDAKENLAFGCALALHIPSKLTAVNCLHELQKIAADQIATVSFEERFGSDEICTPDPKIVRQLVGRGYTENGARRAAFMTGNQSYNDALGWAVTHTLDPDFNEPILILRIPNQRFIDEDSIQLLQKSLFKIHTYLENPGEMTAFLKMVSKTSRGEGDIHNATEAPQPRSRQASSGSLGGTKGKSVPQEHEKVTSPTSASPTYPKATSYLPEHGGTEASPPIPPSSPGTQSKRTTDSSECDDKITPTAQAPPPPPKIATSESQTDAALASQMTVRSSIGTNLPRLDILKPVQVSTTKMGSLLTPSQKSPLSVEDRTRLLEKGKAALNKVRGKVNASDRERLIEQGRQLLRQARANSPAMAAPPRGRPAPPPPPRPAPPPPPPPPGTKGIYTPTVVRPKAMAKLVSTKLENDGSDDSDWGFDDFDMS